MASSYPILYNDPMGVLILAPMAELSHRALRELIESFCPQTQGAPGLPALPKIEYFTEMISAPAFLNGGPFEKWYLDGEPCPERLTYQLLGAEKGVLARAAALLDRENCLGIDLNMGCAAPAITRTGAGVRWMEDIDRAGACAAAVRKMTKKRLSVKLRLGPRPGKPPANTEPAAAAKTATMTGAAITEALPGLDYLIRFCRRLEAEGVELITLHPRRGDEKFRRRARWEYIDCLREALHIPVAGNGDIAGAEELAVKAAAGPAMAGRLGVKNPWAFARAARLMAGGGTDDPAPNLEETGLRFLELLARYQPPEFHLSRARRFFQYFCENLKWGNYVKTLLHRETTLTGIERAWRGYFMQ